MMVITSDSNSDGDDGDQGKVDGIGITFIMSIFLYRIYYLHYP